MDLSRRASGWPFAGAGEEEPSRPFAGAGEEKPSRGELLAGLGQGGAAARPLNGGVLTRWGAHAPARGPAMAPWLPRSTAFVALGSLARLCSLR